MTVMRRSCIVWCVALIVAAAIPLATADDAMDMVSKIVPGDSPMSGMPNIVPTVPLSNGVEIPLVGLGVGNMMPDIVPAMVSHGLQSDKHVRLIDTSHVSQNERHVALGITEGVRRLQSNDETRSEKVEIHVVTKVWYTHLGYNRTKLSVSKSMDAMKAVLSRSDIDIKMHVLLHWPRCYNNIPWMECDVEESLLPEEIKNAGPPPHLDADNAWKESWKALEDLYQDSSNPVASIGVSNFHLKEIQELSRIARIQPHMVQTNIWSLLYDPLLLSHCHKRQIHVQAHYLMNGVIRKAEVAPYGFHHLLVVANELGKKLIGGSTTNTDTQVAETGTDVSASQVLMAWLVQHGMSVVTQTTDLGHLRDNSAVSIARLPKMTEPQVKIVSDSVEALLSGQDLEEDAYIKVTFHAKTKDIYLYWTDNEFGGEVQVSLIKKGKTFMESSHPGHSFRIYDSANKTNYELFTVEGNYGDHRHVEL